MSHSHGAETVDEETHNTSWSANLELPEHEASCERVVDDAVEAVRRTASGYHVNLVTHGAHGHPEDYLYDALEADFGDEITYEYVEQCGCGGHVVRVHVA
ncbi:CGCGG family putative rSAM-modified RiPP protein [Halarchaeum sp. P4]|uniref:CGCGG family putative rSAM-modified RiPP protein n=1 Tax=Halarchaeum sp. P4 TaxID=3421639 RepID=UPI003EBB962E